MDSQRTEQVKRFLKAMMSFRKVAMGRQSEFMQSQRFTPPQIHLMYLVSEGSKTVKELSKILGVSSSATTQMVEGLVKSGLLKRETDPHDRRVARISLSAKGAKEFQEFKDRHFQRMAKVLEDLTDEEMETLIRVQNKILENFKKENHDNADVN